MDSGAFGAGKSSGRFEPLVFIRKPNVILRAVSLLFAIIVFSCIASQGYDEKGECQFNNDNGACNFGTTVGVIAFLGLIALLISDALFENLSSIKQRKYIVMGDMGFSGAWTFFYFVNFCYLTDTWRRSKHEAETGISGCEAAIAFSFFSIGTFGVLTALAYLRYRQGVTEDFLPSGYEPGAGVGQGQMGGVPAAQSPFSGYSAGAGDTDSFQQPFGAPGGQRNPPTVGGSNFRAY